MLSGDTLVGGLIRRGGRGRLRRGGATFPLNELPEEVLVSVFDAVGDLDWVRRTVCKAWDELYRSRDARSLHETIKLDFRGEVESAARKREKERARQRKWEAGGWGSEDEEDWGGGRVVRLLRRVARPPRLRPLGGHPLGREARRLGA